MLEVLPVWSGAYLDGWFPSGEVLAEESRRKIKTVPTESFGMK